MIYSFSVLTEPLLRRHRPSWLSAKRRFRRQTGKQHGADSGDKLVNDESVPFQHILHDVTLQASPLRNRHGGSVAEFSIFEVDVEVAETKLGVDPGEQLDTRRPPIRRRIEWEQGRKHEPSAVVLASETPPPGILRL